MQQVKSEGKRILDLKKNECKLGIFTVNAVKQPQNMQDQKSNRGENLNINSLFDLKVNYSINVFVTTFTSSNAGLF